MHPYDPSFLPVGVVIIPQVRTILVYSYNGNEDTFHGCLLFHEKFMYHELIDTIRWILSRNAETRLHHRNEMSCTHRARYRLHEKCSERYQFRM